MGIQAPFPGGKLDNENYTQNEVWKIVQGLGTRKKEVGVVGWTEIKRQVVVGESRGEALCRPGWLLRPNQPAHTAFHSPSRRKLRCVNRPEIGLFSSCYTQISRTSWDTSNWSIVLLPFEDTIVTRSVV